jgi:hypothetical protein
MSVGTMTLHRFNGDEIYSVQSATIKQNQMENGLFAITFRAETAWPPIKMLPDTESLRGKPTAEVTIHVDEPAAVVLKTGATFSLAKGYDESTREQQANFYYREHEPMDENEIEVLEREGPKIQISILGTVRDVNHYDGSKPRTKVTIVADFTLVL